MYPQDMSSPYISYIDNNTYEWYYDVERESDIPTDEDDVTLVVAISAGN